MTDALRAYALLNAVQSGSPTAALVSQMIQAAGLWERMRAPLGGVSFVPPRRGRAVLNVELTVDLHSADNEVTP